MSRGVDGVDYLVFPSLSYINFLASLLATDKPLEEKDREAGKRIIVHSSSGEISTTFNDHRDLVTKGLLVT